MEKSQNNNQAKNINVQSASAYRRFITSFSYTIWAALGLFIFVLLSIAVFGSGSWQENLNLAPTQDDGATTQEDAGAAAPAPEQQAPPQQPPEPTAEQLACVGEELGEERLNELTAGAESSDPEEIAVIEACLTEE